MTIAFVNGASWAIGTTADPSTTFTPSGATDAILLLIVQNTNQDQIAGVTVGGVAMDELPLSPFLAATSEASTIYGYLINGTYASGVGVTVAVDTTATTNKQAYIYGLSCASGQDVAVEDTSTFSSSSQANPSCDLTTTAALNTFVAYAIHSGQSADTGVTPAAAFTSLYEFDFGQQVCGFRRRTSNATGGTVSVQETQTAEDAAMFSVALKEASSSLTAVGDEVQALWDVRNKIGDEVQALWDVRQLASDTTELRWDVRQLATDNLQLLWDVLGPVTAVGDTIQLLWDVRNAVGDTAELRWDVRQLATDNVQALWDVRNKIGDTAELRWDVRNLAADQLQALWDVRNKIGDTAELRWDVRNLAGDQVQLLWDVASTLTAVSDDLVLRWDVRNAVGAERQLLWDVLQTVTAVGDTVQLLWDVRNSVGDTVELRWDVRQALAKLLSLSWDVRDSLIIPNRIHLKRTRLHRG